jgi:cytoskeletal protein RodZ
MAVFNNNSSELPESQIEYHDDRGGRRVVTLIIYIVLALAVATLVVFAGRWVYHKVSNDSGPTPTAVAPQNTNQGNTSTAPNTAAPSSGSPNSSSSGSSSANKAPATSNNPTPAPSPGTGSSNGSTKHPSTSTPAPTPAALPNNGPGEVIALFAATTLVAGTLHFVAASRKLLKDA